MKTDFKNLVTMDLLTKYIKERAKLDGVNSASPVETIDETIHAGVCDLLEAVRLELVMNDGIYGKLWGVV